MTILKFRPNGTAEIEFITVQTTGVHGARANHGRIELRNVRISAKRITDDSGNAWDIKTGRPVAGLKRGTVIWYDNRDSQRFVLNARTMPESYYAAQEADTLNRYRRIKEGEERQKKIRAAYDTMILAREAFEKQTELDIERGNLWGWQHEYAVRLRNAKSDYLALKPTKTEREELHANTFEKTGWAE